jgi:hypothetical protein
LRPVYRGLPIHGDAISLVERDHPVSIWDQLLVGILNVKDRLSGRLPRIGWLLSTLR